MELTEEQEELQEELLENLEEINNELELERDQLEECINIYIDKMKENMSLKRAKNFAMTDCKNFIKEYEE